MNKKTGKKQIKKAALLKNTVEENFVSGWYTAKVYTKDGQVHEFKDLVDLCHPFLSVSSLLLKFI